MTPAHKLCVLTKSTFCLGCGDGPLLQLNELSRQAAKVPALTAELDQTQEDLKVGRPRHGHGCVRVRKRRTGRGQRLAGQA